MNKIKVELTEDQYKYLFSLLIHDAERAQETANKMNMGLSERFLSFNRRLRLTLAKAKS